MTRDTLPADEPPPDPADAALDIRVVRSLTLIADGDAAAFARTTEPSLEFVAWMQSSDLATVNGVLIHALRRWHEIRLGDASPGGSP